MPLNWPGLFRRTWENIIMALSNSTESQNTPLRFLSFYTHFLAKLKNVS